MADEEDQLREAVTAELEWGVGFLAKEGHPGAGLILSPPDQFGAHMWELGGRFAAWSDQRSYAVVELDPGRRGWRVEWFLTVCRDDEDSCDIGERGWARLLEFDETLSECRVTARRAVVALRDYLNGRRSDLTTE